MVKLLNEHLLQKYQIFNTKYNKFTVFSDLHFPFQDTKLLNKALNSAKGDVLVITGDILDAYSASFYPKDKPITIEEEIDSCIDFLKLCSKRFEEVYICLGNHDYRVIKCLENLPFGILSFTKASVMSELLKRLKVSDNIYIGAWWLLFLNQMAFAHADTYSGLPLKPVLTLQNHIAKVHPDKYGKISAIFQGHTHHIGMSVSYGKLLIQLPCMQLKANYRYNERLVSSVNMEWQKGWMEFETNKWGIDISSIKFYLTVNKIKNTPYTYFIGG